MNIKEFLKPDWKKVILPILIIIMYFLLVNRYYQIGDVLDEYMCDSISLSQSRLKARESNDTEAIEAFFKETKELNDKMKVPAARLDLDNIIDIHNFMKFINPFMPVPCEVDSKRFCVHYLSEETYNCVENYTKNMQESHYPGLISPVINKEYRKVSIIAHLLNVIFIFVEGYLVSAFIIFIYRKILFKNGKKQTTSHSNN